MTTTLIFGLLVGAGFVYLSQRDDVQLAWYDWLLLAVAMVFYLLAVVNFNQSRAELEPRAASILLLSFGVPGVILTAIVAVRAWRNRDEAALAD